MTTYDGFPCSLFDSNQEGKCLHTYRAPAIRLLFPQNLRHSFKFDQLEEAETRSINLRA